MATHSCFRLFYFVGYFFTLMDIILGNGCFEIPRAGEAQLAKKKEIGRSCANFHPSVWGDRLLAASRHDKEPNVDSKQRAEELKEEVKKMFLGVNDLLHNLNLIDAIQRLGVAYHFEEEINKALKCIFDDSSSHEDYNDNLHVVALRFRLLRQNGYDVLSDVFRNFKDGQGNFKATLSTDIRGLLSLYEAAYLSTDGDDILDEAIAFTTEHLKSALPHTSSPLANLVKLALDVPLRKRVERLQSRCYISIYEEDTQRNDVLLEFAKLDFNMLQSLHRRELKDISRWWKEGEFAKKLPFARDRVVECYFWILGVYFEPHYSRARRMMATVISLTSLMDDIYDVYGTLEELELYTAALERWDRSVIDQLPDYMKVHFVALLDAVDQFEAELSHEGKSNRITYLKAAFKGVARAYLQEAKWASLDYVPTYEEYMEVALVSGAYPMLTVASLVGMGDAVSEEVLKWAISIPKVTMASAIICRLKNDITSSELEQEREGHVASALQCYIKEHGTSHADTCRKFQEMVALAWKDINKECLQPTAVPLSVIMRAVNLSRVIELLYAHQDSYTNSSNETKEAIGLVLVEPVPL